MVMCAMANKGCVGGQMHLICWVSLLPLCNPVSLTHQKLHGFVDDFLGRPHNEMLDYPWSELAFI